MNNGKQLLPLNIFVRIHTRNHQTSHTYYVVFHYEIIYILFKLDLNNDDMQAFSLHALLFQLFLR